MLEGQEPPLLATATIRVDEGALAPVAFPDLPRDGERDVARIRPRLHDSTRLAGTGSPLQLALDELVESAFEELCQVTAGQSVARELSRLLDLGAERGARRELNAIALRGERFDPRAKITRKPTPRCSRGVCLGTGKPWARAGRRFAKAAAAAERSEWRARRDGGPATKMRVSG